MTTSQSPPGGVPAPVVRDLGGGLRLTTLTTGWISVRTAHREFAGPDPLALPAILTGRRWTAWMPINVFVVQHPATVVVVDTGEAVHRPPGHFGDGRPGQELFCRRMLRFAIPPEADLGRQLRSIGLAPGDVSTVVLTHLHTDHTGNLHLFDRADVLVGAGGLHPYAGSTRGRLPAGRTREIAGTEEPVGPWPSALPLTLDGAVQVIPLPGHTPGHQGLLLQTDPAIVIVGDVAFGHEQIRCGHPPGIATDRAANRATQDLLADVARTGSRLLFAHVDVAAELG